MRILLINSEYPPVGGGASNASANIAAAWAQAGNQVAVLTARFQMLPQDALENGVRVIRIPAIRKRRDRSGPFEQLVFMLSAIWYALRMKRDLRPDVTVAFFGVPSGPAGLLLKQRYGIPFVVSLRGSDVPGFRSYDFGIYHRMLSPLIKLIWRNAAVLVANSKGLRDLARSFDAGIPIRVIPNGVDTRRFEVGARQWQPPVLLTVGRLVHQKGIDLLFQSLAALKDQEWKLLIVGDGKGRRNLERLTETLEINDRVEFVGWQSRETIVNYYRDANLYVHPSHDEGMSNAILEAMASGLPVLATGVAGNMEVILDGSTGRLIPPADSGALREVLVQMLPDSKVRQEMGQAGRERVVRNFSWQRTSQAYLEILSEILSTRDE
jgi:glycosyltransferase involved in cell wall biosynthesis